MLAEVGVPLRRSERHNRPSSLAIGKREVLEDGHAGLNQQAIGVQPVHYFFRFPGPGRFFQSARVAVDVGESEVGLGKSGPDLAGRLAQRSRG